MNIIGGYLNHQNKILENICEYMKNKLHRFLDKEVLFSIKKNAGSENKKYIYRRTHEKLEKNMLTK